MTRQRPSTRRPALGRSVDFGLRLAAVSLLLVACTQPIRSGDDLVRELQQIGCISRCQEIKDRCDADARFDYAQCQAGYSGAMRDYRWCLADAGGECGYPWWSCSENRYGYCTNRYWECHTACRRPGG